MRNDAFIPAMVRGAGTGVQPVLVSVTISAFSYANAHTIPSILAEYPLENTVSVSLRRLMPSNLLKVTSFALAVRFQNEDDITVRYVLHRPAGFYGLLYPSYGGQGLSAEAVIEVWSIVGITPAVISTDIVLNTGPFTFQPAVPFYTGVITPTEVTLTATTFVATTTGPTNPFADSAMLAEG